jgi:hypothetical protein
MLLTQLDIASLLKQEPITDEWPWNTSEEVTVCENIRDILAQVRGKLRLLDKSEFGHYGSGYASFADCWLYRDEPEFKFDTGNRYWGLVALFSTLSHYYVIGEGQKAWDNKSASSYLPSFEFVDRITHPAAQNIADGVCAILNNRGLVRAHADDLSESLPRNAAVPTILANPPFHHFDALFYWED